MAIEVGVAAAERQRADAMALRPIAEPTGERALATSFRSSACIRGESCQIGVSESETSRFSCDRLALEQRRT